MPHIHCYLGTGSLIWTMFTTDSLIALAYVSIAFSLYRLVRKIDLPFHSIFIAFGLFIFACGITHVMEVYTLWYPEYWWAATAKVVTAVASVVTAVSLSFDRSKIADFANAAALSEQRKALLIEQYELLRKSDEKFRLFIETIKDYAIFILDPRGRVVTWNEGAKRIKQYNADEIIGKDFSVFYSKKDRDLGKPTSELKKALLYGRAEDEGWRFKKDGSKFWANVIISPVFDSQNNHVGFSKITRDLTGQKKLEDDLRQSNESLEKRIQERTEELRESETQFRTLANAMPHLAWIAGADGSVFWFNDQWFEYTGMGPEKSAKVAWKEILKPDELHKIHKRWGHSIQTGKSFEMDVQMRRADGAYRWFLTRAIPVRNAKGVIIRWFGTNTDIDDKRRFLDLQARSNFILEERVKERTLELEWANKEIESFSYSVSHDLRTPLRSISGFSNRLLERSRDRLDEEGRDNLKRVIAATQRMGKLIDDLLNLSRVTRKSFIMKSVDLGALAESVNLELEHLDPTHHVSVHIQDHLTPVKGDPNLLRVVLQNLLDNARKYSSKTEHARIEVGETQIKSKTVYFVRDNGVGFDMRYSKKLFGAFQRLHAEEDFSGTGIGLATVKRIMHRHGGDVWCDAAPGKGAIFYFSFEHIEREKYDYDQSSQCHPPG